MSISLPADLEFADARLAAREAFRLHYEISLTGDRQATLKTLADWQASTQRVRQLG